MGRAQWFTVLALATLLLPVTPVLGQEEEEPLEILDADAFSRIIDPADDAREIGPTTDQPDNGAHPQAEIIEVWVGNETLETVEVGIRFKEVPDPQAAGAQIPFSPVDVSVAPGFTIAWTMDDANFSIAIGGEMTNCGGSGPQFRRQHARGSSTHCGAYDPVVDDVGKSLRFTLPREILLNATDVPFGPGADIKNLYATASYPVTPGPAGTTVRDRAPDEGFGPDYHSTLAGEAGTGAFVLTAIEPVRVSNGESTTLVYPVELESLADQPRIIHLSYSNEMDDWQIRVPARLELPARTTIKFPVILSMGFTHDHGGLTTFDVRA